MKLLAALFTGKKENKETKEKEKREALVNVGRKQFKRLQELGLNIPIAVL